MTKVVLPKFVILGCTGDYWGTSDAGFENFSAIVGSSSTAGQIWKVEFVSSSEKPEYFCIEKIEGLAGTLEDVVFAGSDQQLKYASTAEGAYVTCANYRTSPTQALSPILRSCCGIFASISF